MRVRKRRIFISLPEAKRKKERKERKEREKKSPSKFIHFFFSALVKPLGLEKMFNGVFLKFNYHVIYLSWNRG